MAEAVGQGWHCGTITGAGSWLSTTPTPIPEPLAASHPSQHPPGPPRAPPSENNPQRQGRTRAPAPAPPAANKRQMPMKPKPCQVLSVLHGADQALAMRGPQTPNRGGHGYPSLGCWLQDLQVAAVVPSPLHGCQGGCGAPTRLIAAAPGAMPQGRRGTPQLRGQGCSVQPGCMRGAGRGPPAAQQSRDTRSSPGSLGNPSGCPSREGAAAKLSPSHSCFEDDVTPPAATQC